MEPAALHLAAIGERDRLELGPVVVDERRLDREATVQPRVRLIDELRRGRLRPDPAPREHAVDREPDREQRGVELHRRQSMPGRPSAPADALEPTRIEIETQFLKCAVDASALQRAFMRHMKRIITATLGLAACTSSPTSTGFEIVSANGHELSAVAGDALALQVVETFSDGSTRPAADATWVAPITIVPLDPDSTAASPIPTFGTAPTAVFVDATLRTDRDDDLTGVLFALDAGSTPGGTTTATAMVGSAMATISIPIGATPAGNATNGATKYAAGCSDCHGTMAQGTPASSDGSYTIDGNAYAFPAPGLDTESGNLASDPGWNA